MFSAIANSNDGEVARLMMHVCYAIYFLLNHLLNSKCKNTHRHHEDHLSDYTTNF